MSFITLMARRIAEKSGEARPRTRPVSGALVSSALTGWKSHPLLRSPRATGMFGKAVSPPAETEVVPSGPRPDRIPFAGRWAGWRGRRWRGGRKG